MKLNKFRPFSCYSLRVLSCQLVALSLFCCKKTANINANKAFVNVTHTAYNTGPVTMNFEGIPLFTEPLAFGSSTGNASSPYDTTTAGVQDLQLLQSDTVLLSGNTALQQASYYSMFVYDFLNQNTIKIIVFQNNVGYTSDTAIKIRFLNFTPGSDVGIKVVFIRDTAAQKASGRDSVNIGPSLFVGENPNPVVYNFTTVHKGHNDIYSFTDSARPTFDSSNFRRLGSLDFDSAKNYNVFLQGFYDTLSGVNKFQVKSVLTN